MATVRRLAAALLVVLVLAARAATAAAYEFDDKLAWEEAAGSFATIDFTGLPDGTPVTDQYAELGILFTDGSDIIDFNAFAYPNDGVGLAGFSETVIEFDQPMHTIAADFPGFLRFELYSAGDLIYESSLFGSSGVGFFGGLVVDQSFDMVVIADPTGGTFMDDLHFGPVPAPPSILLFAAAACFGTRRRREG